MNNCIYVLAATVFASSFVACAPIGDPDEADGTASYALNDRDFAVDCGPVSGYLAAPMVLNDDSGGEVVNGGLVQPGAGVDVAFDVPQGSRLLSVRYRVAPAQHSSLNGILMPYIELHKVTPTTDVVVGQIAWDPSAVPNSTWNPSAKAAIAYSEAHDIVSTLSQPALSGSYYLRFAQEWGGGQASAGRVCGAHAEISSVNP